MTVSKVDGFRIAKQVLDGLEDGAVRFLVERLRLEDVDHGIDGRQLQHARTENRFLQLDGLRLFLADSGHAGGEGGILYSAFALGLQGFVFGHVQQGMKNQIRRSRAHSAPLSTAIPQAYPQLPCPSCFGPDIPPPSLAPRGRAGWMQDGKAPPRWSGFSRRLFHCCDATVPLPFAFTDPAATSKAPPPGVVAGGHRPGIRRTVVEYIRNRTPPTRNRGPDLIDTVSLSWPVPQPPSGSSGPIPLRLTAVVTDGEGGRGAHFATATIPVPPLSSTGLWHVEPDNPGALRFFPTVHTKTPPLT